MTSPSDSPGPATGGLPTALRRRVLDASLNKRPPGRYTPAPPPITTLEALSRTSQSFGGVLAGLTDDQWRLPVLRDLDIQGLVGHLIGVEGDVQRSLQGDPDVADADHVGSTQSAAESQLGEPPGETLRAWRDAVARSLAAFGSVDPESSLGLHTMRLRAGSLMLARTFELWAHENDIRQVTGQRPSVPDDSTLTMMTELAARSLPVGAARTRLRTPVDLRLVLTGPGGGPWTVRLGPEVGTPAELGVVTDAIGFCRLAANRLDPGDLVVDPRGELSRLPDVLAAAAALALD